jgi:hypothetical protein
LAEMSMFASVALYGPEMEMKSWLKGLTSRVG